MGRVTLRPTILADLPHVIGEPLPYRIRTITALVNGRVIGIGGVAFPPRGPAIAFVQLTPPAPSAGEENTTFCPRDGADVAAGDPLPPGVPKSTAIPDEASCFDNTPAMPEAKRYPVAFHRAGLMAMMMIREWGIVHVVATADPENAAAVRWLKRLGFGPAENQGIEGRVLFYWQRNGRLADDPEIVSKDHMHCKITAEQPQWVKT